MNINTCWATVIIEELVRQKVINICIAPGSRSAPLTIAAAKHSKVKTYTHFDERGLCYFALGLAKSSKSPVAIITTSGTAVANLLPAIVEAYLTNVPLIILSADRPLELIDCGANQAIPQNEIFAQFTSSHWCLVTPNEDSPLHYPITMTSRAVAECVNLQKPVHLNIPFAEPLYPNQGISISSTKENELNEYLALENLEAICKTNGNIKKFKPDSSLYELVNNCNGIIWAGKIDREEDAIAILDLAHHLGWPVIADSQSQLKQNNEALVFVDLLLEFEEFANLLKSAEVILKFGGRFISKTVSNFLNSFSHAKFVNVIFNNTLTDSEYHSDMIYNMSAEIFCRGVIDMTQSKPSWIKLSTYILNMKVEMFLDSYLKDYNELSVVHFISKYLPGALMLGNSLPARNFELCAGIINHQHHHVYSNRGASGIDGILATACGIAKLEGQPTTLIIGDTSALHDLNSFALIKDLPIAVVILNNSGGNIFSVLDGARNSEYLEEFFELQHDVSFENVAKMFNVPYVKVTNMKELSNAYILDKKNTWPKIIECKLPHNEYRDISLNLKKAISLENFNFSYM